MLEDILSEADQALTNALDRYSPRIEPREVGTVISVGQGVARVEGLPGVAAEELVSFAGGVHGMALNLDPDEVGVVLLGEAADLAAGSHAQRTGRVVDVPVGDQLIGRVVGATGAPLDSRGALREVTRRPIEAAAPAILDRAPVTTPLETGVKVVDALVPIGRGQRELIIGDRQTGKTALAVDTLIHQSDKDVIAIYCAIGQRGSAVARVIADLEKHGAMGHCVVLVASGEDPPGFQFIAPYAATTIAEYFVEQGRDVVIVYDDLTRHARAYRELSLLLRRPPGREAYPGDIFYVHSRLLERSTQLREERGGGSLTALPIVETEGQNLSAYIPTNLISITDGQVYLSPDLFEKGILPAVDVGKSVSRVGGKTQLRAYRDVAGELRLAYAQFEELEAFARFGTRLDEATRATLERGRRVREILKQGERAPLRVAQQIAVLAAVGKGLLDPLPLDKVAHAEAELLRALDERIRSLEPAILRGESLAAGDRDLLLDEIRSVLGQRISAATEA